MRCLGRIGCLLVLALLGAGAWLTRGTWRNLVPRIHRGGSETSVPHTTERTWQPLDPRAAVRSKRAIDALSSPKGPVYTTLTASEIASYVYQLVGHSIPATADSVEAAVIGDVLYIRAIVPMKAIGASEMLGPLGGLLNERERITLGGTFHVVRPGLSEFRVREIKLRDFRVPSAAIPRLVRQLTKGKHTDGIDADALPVATPATLGDVRIANNRVTLYKTIAP